MKANQIVMTPFFSIIIPVYNVAPYLRESLDSVLVQTFTDWEAICVDDGSNDGSGAILDEYAAKDKRFRVIHQTNAGVSTARNVAKRLVRGKWVGFVDGDDAISTHWFEVVHSAIIRNSDAKWIRMGVAFWRDEKKPTIKQVEDVRFFEYDHEQTVIRGWKSILPHGYPWRNFYDSSLLAGRDFNPKLRIQEDMYYSLDLLPLISSSVWTDYDGYYYRYRTESAWNGKMRLEDAKNNIGELLSVWSRQADYILSHPEHIDIQRLIARISIQIIVERFRQQFLETHRKEAEELSRLIKKAVSVKAFVPSLVPMFKNKVRWTLFCKTGSWAFFKPLSYFYKFQWLSERWR